MIGVVFIERYVGTIQPFYCNRAQSAQKIVTKWYDSISCSDITGTKQCQKFLSDYGWVECRLVAATMKYYLGFSTEEASIYQLN